MRCLVFEPSRFGHRFSYLRHLVEAIAEPADEIIVTVNRSAPGTDEYREHIEPIEPRVTVDASMSQHEHLSAIGFCRQTFAALRSVVHQHRPDHVFVPSADGVTQMLGPARIMGINPFRAGVESECVTLRETFAYPTPTTRGWLSARMSLIAAKLAPWTIVHHIDPLPFERLQRQGGRYARRSRLIPEPVESITALDKGEARHRLQIPESGRYIGCAGFLDRRKGTDLLIRAFAEAPRDEDDRLLLVGVVDGHIRSLLEGDYAPLVAGGRIIVIDRFVSDVEFATSLSAMDVVAACHPHQIGSSGIVVRAPKVARPLLGSGFGWVGRMINRFSLGQTCEVRDHDALVAAVSKSLQSADELRLNEAASRFVQFHTVSNFAASVSQRLRDRVGKPPADGLRTWRWVNEPLGD